MKYNIISVKFDDNDGYGSIKTLRAYDELLPVEKLDALSDAIQDLVRLYNSELSVWHIQAEALIEDRKSVKQ